MHKKLERSITFDTDLSNPSKKWVIAPPLRTTGLNFSVAGRCPNLFFCYCRGIHKLCWQDFEDFFVPPLLVHILTTQAYVVMLTFGWTPPPPALTFQCSLWMSPGATITSVLIYCKQKQSCFKRKIRVDTSKRIDLRRCMSPWRSMTFARWRLRNGRQSWFLTHKTCHCLE